MDRLNNLASYFNEKERKRLNAIAKNTSSGLPEMSVSMAIGGVVVVRLLF
jgi:hypothetical protein